MHVELINGMQEVDLQQCSVSRPDSLQLNSNYERGTAKEN
jgi:hypothetical protein